MRDMDIVLKDFLDKFIGFPLDAPVIIAPKDWGYTSVWYDSDEGCVYIDPTYVEQK